MKRRYALVGTGSRGFSMFLLPLAKEYADVAEIVALCDLNPKRAALAASRLGLDLPLYTDFAQMLREVPCDTVIVTSKDATHHEFIIQALQAGKDVITEKPMTIDDAKCRAILKAERESGKKVTVTFNYRFAPYATKIKELMAAGKVGEVYSVEFHWFLDTRHGADYYRRWHGEMRNSGGLLVHKATHHFDLVNWFLNQEPEEVYARGQLRFYGAHRRPHGERCLTCPHTSSCPFYLDLRQSEDLKALYLDVEDADGYWRDRCVFADRINIYDTMAAIVSYRQGATLSYTLSAYMPFEGWRMAINGSRGRLECGVAEMYYPEETPDFAARGEIGQAIDPWQAARGDLTPVTADTIRFYPTFGGVETIVVPRVSGGHGGGDERLREHLFRGPLPDPLGHMADSMAGARSILIGIAANKAIALGKPVRIAELLEEKGN